MNKIIRRNKRRLITLTMGAMVSLMFLASCSTSKETSNDKLSAQKIQLLQKALEQYRTKYHIPGMSISIIMPNSDQVLTLTSGVKNIKSKVAVTPDTLFQIGSITKVYTAILIHQLISDGKLSLAQTLGDWLPQYKKWNKITIKQLLNMHSGIPSYTEDKKFNAAWQKNPTKSWTPSADLKYVEDKPLLYKPGANYNYSDSNYILLGMIIEKAANKSYKEMLRQNIIEPLGLKQTFYILREYTKAELTKMATGYSKDTIDQMNVNMSQADAAGAIVATTKDTAIFFHAIFKGRLLKPKELKAMLVPYSTTSGQKMRANSKMFETWALGIDQNWFPKVGLTWNKFGITPGGFFGSANYSIRGHVTIVMLANKTVSKAMSDETFIPKLYDIIGIGIDKR